jgi:hypothetical protein
VVSISHLLTRQEWRIAVDIAKVNHSERIFVEPTGTQVFSRERITRARQAAEALFTAKPPVSVPSVADAAADQSPRKPRVLQVTSLPPTPVTEVKASVSVEPASTPSISTAHFAHIRTWMRYGMTIAEVAAVYGLAVDELARILRNA